MNGESAFGPVLAGTDLTARSDRAVDRATRIARDLAVRLIVLHALDPDTAIESDQSLAEHAMRKALPDPAADVDVLPAIGPAPAAICAAAASTRASVIVTGTGRMNSIREFFLGTTVEQVIRNVALPVLVVRERPHHAYRRLLVGTDCSPCSRAALLAAARLFPDAALHVVHAVHAPAGSADDAMPQARACLDAFLADPAIGAPLRARMAVHLARGEPHTVLCDALARTEADLLVLGTHGNSGFVRAMIGSRAEKLLRCAPVDTLVVRESC